MNDGTTSGAIEFPTESNDISRRRNRRKESRKSTVEGSCLSSTAQEPVSEPESIGSKVSRKQTNYYYNTHKNESKVSIYSVINDSYCALLYADTTMDVKDQIISYPHVTYYGFDDLFPQAIQERDSQLKSFSQLFHSSVEFREQLRRAARVDFSALFQHQEVTNNLNGEKKMDAISNLLVRDLKSTYMSYWRNNRHFTSITTSLSDYPNINNLFLKFGLKHISGSEFIGKLTSLCGNSQHVFGSWIDICGVKERNIPHSWHQDSGLDQCTVMVGFPAENHYSGVGVFSHAVRLSHRLPPHTLPQPRVWQSFKKSSSSSGNVDEKNELQEGSFDEEYVVRPLYEAGREVMVYNDRDIFHSAPDWIYRDSIWRFM